MSKRHRVSIRERWIFDANTRSLLKGLPMSKTFILFIYIKTNIMNFVLGLIIKKV